MKNYDPKNINFYWAHNHHVNDMEYSADNILYIENKKHKWFWGHYLRMKLKKTIKNKKMCEEINNDYIEQTEITDEIKNKKIITIDPGFSDLIYCGSEDKNGNLETFRYTQNQRRMETRIKKYNKLLDNINKESIINNKSVKELETILSKYNSKTINYDKFKEYIIKKIN